MAVKMGDAYSLFALFFISLLTLGVIGKKNKKSEGEDDYSSLYTSILKSYSRETNTSYYIPQHRLEKLSFLHDCLYVISIIFTSQLIYIFGTEEVIINIIFSHVLIIVFISILLLMLYFCRKFILNKPIFHVIGLIDSYNKYKAAIKEDISSGWNNGFYASLSKLETIDIPVMRQLDLMLKNSEENIFRIILKGVLKNRSGYCNSSTGYKSLRVGYNYPSNWRPYIWDFTKMIVNYCLVNSMLKKNKDSATSFKGLFYFHVFLAFPLVVILISFLGAPLVLQYIHHKPTEGIVIYLCVSINVMVWLWINYSEIVNYQLWHFFPAPESRKNIILSNYEIVGMDLNYFKVNQVNDEFINLIVGKGGKLIYFLMFGFLPVYVTYLSVLSD